MKANRKPRPEPRPIQSRAPEKGTEIRTGSANATTKGKKRKACTKGDNGFESPSAPPKKSKTRLSAPQRTENNSSGSDAKSVGAPKNSYEAPRAKIAFSSEGMGSVNPLVPPNMVGACDRTASPLKAVMVHANPPASSYTTQAYAAPLSSAQSSSVASTCKVSIQPVVQDFVLQICKYDQECEAHKECREQICEKMSTQLISPMAKQDISKNELYAECFFPALAVLASEAWKRQHAIIRSMLHGDGPLPQTFNNFRVLFEDVEKLASKFGIPLPISCASIYTLAGIKLLLAKPPEDLYFLISCIEIWHQVASHNEVSYPERTLRNLFDKYIEKMTSFQSITDDTQKKSAMESAFIIGIFALNLGAMEVYKEICVSFFDRAKRLYHPPGFLRQDTSDYIANQFTILHSFSNDILIDFRTRNRLSGMWDILRNCSEFPNLTSEKITTLFLTS